MNSCITIYLKKYYHQKNGYIGIDNTQNHQPREGIYMTVANKYRCMSPFNFFGFMCVTFLIT